MSWQLQEAGPANLEQIMKIERVTFPEDAWSQETMLAEISSPHTYYLICFDPRQPHELIGYGGVLAPKGSAQADIQTVAVAQEFRNRGIGRVLLERLIAKARSRGAEEVFLEVRADNPVAIGIYRSLGFEQVDLRRGYYQPAGVDAIVMRAPILQSLPGLAEGGGS
ncbi:MAG: ribosomal protein S18-alanine N-acetyltransferase [Cryobacterium sp.]|nr:ribosomal protein S18-alanine N-acetyltransferase [Cryobacterium sp.]